MSAYKAYKGYIQSMSKAMSMSMSCSIFSKDVFNPNIIKRPSTFRVFFYGLV